MNQAYEAASMTIFRTSASSEVEVPCIKGVNPKTVIANPPIQVGGLACLIFALLAITKALRDNKVPCIAPLTENILNREDNKAATCCHLFKTGKTLKDAWMYILSINELSVGVVNKIDNYDDNYFTELLETPLIEFRKFSFSPL